jgi:hypothetical protein
MELMRRLAAVRIAAANHSNRFRELLKERAIERIKAQPFFRLKAEDEGLDVHPPMDLSAYPDRTEVVVIRPSEPLQRFNWPDSDEPWYWP